MYLENQSTKRTLEVEGKSFGANANLFNTYMNRNCDAAKFLNHDLYEAAAIFVLGYRHYNIRIDTTYELIFDGTLLY
jgi:hypothetical protein